MDKGETTCELQLPSLCKKLKLLQSGDAVWLPEFKSKKVVEEKQPCSYTVQSTDGAYGRNCQHLILLPTPTTEGNDSRDKN